MMCQTKAIFHDQQNNGRKYPIKLINLAAIALTRA